MARGRFDVERLGAPIAALAAAAALGVGLFAAARSVNRPPTVAEIRVEPAVVLAGTTATVRVTADDPDGDALRFEYRAQAGRLTVPDAARPHEARYTPPQTAASVDRLTVAVTDGRGLTTTATTAVTIDASLPTPLPTPAPTVEPAADPAPEPEPERAPTEPPAVPTSAPAPALPPPTAGPAPKRAPNRPPTLEGGQLISEVVDSTVGLEARGTDPDGDTITHAWDFGGCLDSEGVIDTTRADVKLKPGCDQGTAILTWTDPHGGFATTVWTVTR